MKYLPLLLFILPFTLCLSQAPTGKEFPYAKRNPSVANLGANHILDPGNSQPLEGFFTKIDQLIFDGDQKINIVHMGGSHIQADIWSGQIRERLQTLIPGSQGGRGMVFPYRMARTNNPYHYYPEYTGRWEVCRNVQRRKTCDLGLAGIQVKTRDTLTHLNVRFRGDFAEGYDFNRVKIFHLVDSLSYSIQVDSVNSPYEIIPFPEEGYSEIRFLTYQKDIHLTFRRTAPHQTHFTLYGLSLETNDPGFVYHAIGVNGASVPSYLRCNLLEENMKVIRPDLVVFSIGINDAYTTSFDVEEFKANYDTLITQIRTASPDCAILFTTNNDSYYKKRYVNKNGRIVQQAMMDLAAKHNAAVWDLFAVMGGQGSVNKWVNEGLCRGDRVHFTVEGYKMIGDLMFNAMLEAYDQHLEGSD